MQNEIKITNGKAADPSLKLNGQVKDLYISDGKIVSPCPSEINTFKKTYNVSGMIIMAGGIDIHSILLGVM